MINASDGWSVWRSVCESQSTINASDSRYDTHRVRVPGLRAHACHSDAKTPNTTHGWEEGGGVWCVCVWGDNQLIILCVSPSFDMLGQPDEFFLGSFFVVFLAREFDAYTPSTNLDKIPRVRNRSSVFQTISANE